MPSQAEFIKYMTMSLLIVMILKKTRKKTKRKSKIGKTCIEENSTDTVIGFTKNK